MQIASIPSHEVLMDHGPDILSSGLSSSISPLSTSTRRRVGACVPFQIAYRHTGHRKGATVVHPVISQGCSYSRMSSHHTSVPLSSHLYVVSHKYLVKCSVFEI